MTQPLLAPSSLPCSTRAVATTCRGRCPPAGPCVRVYAAPARFQPGARMVIEALLWSRCHGQLSQVHVLPNPRFLLIMTTI